jgi:hypothetical protein
MFLTFFSVYNLGLTVPSNMGLLLMLLTHLLLQQSSAVMVRISWEFARLMLTTSTQY